MFIRDYSINTMVACSDSFWDAGFAIFGTDFDAMVVWTHGA